MGHLARQLLDRAGINVVGKLPAARPSEIVRGYLEGTIKVEDGSDGEPT